MHYLITGHTGFKGSWLSLMLELQGHTVSGISLDPEERSLFNQANLSNIFEHDVRLDIRHGSELSKVIRQINPQVIIHLAAQPLVRESYKYPSKTFETNVMGTINVLEATKLLKDLRFTLIVTTDKVYKNLNRLRGYVETDELGGDDPYSASKAAADIAAQSWIKSFGASPIAIARAGNVIGGGDWGTDRIIPDLVDAYSVGEVPLIRYPGATRPWQHVLDCLNGYLTLANSQLITGTGGEWNFGPQSSATHSVEDLVDAFGRSWGVEGALWQQNSMLQPAESNYLLLDSKKAHNLLSWKEKLDFDTTIDWCVNWYRFCKIGDPTNEIRSFTQDQITRFFSLF